jgi:hypothetical protein
MKIFSMAMTREQFEGKLSEFLTGAMGEYLKARVSEIMVGSNKYTGKWDKEVDRLIRQELVNFYYNQTTKTNFKREKLLLKVLKETTSNQMSWFGTELQNKSMSFRPQIQFG